MVRKLKIQKYIHSIDLNNWHVCWNLSLKGILWSSKLFQKHNPAFIVENITTDPILTEITTTPTPTGTMILNDSDPRRIKVELDFEKTRQLQFSNLPSRLSCLWVAENSKEGKEMLDNMFPDKFDRKIVLVELLPNSKIHKLDKRWYEQYYSDKNKEYILKYWQGIAFNEKPRWEFLIDGGFKISKEDLLFLRKTVHEKHKERLGEEFVKQMYKINSVRELD